MREIIHMLPLTFRRRGLRVAASLLLRAVLNLAGLAALLPVLALLLTPGAMRTGALARWFGMSGFASESAFALAGCDAAVAVVILKTYTASCRTESKNRERNGPELRKRQQLRRRNGRGYLKSEDSGSVHEGFLFGSGISDSADATGFAREGHRIPVGGMK